jgi:hypothetical protein
MFDNNEDEILEIILQKNVWLNNTLWVNFVKTK